MAQIDPRLQERLTAVVTGLADSLRDLGRVTGEAALAVQDMAVEMDKLGHKEADCIAASAITKARK